MKIRKTLNSVSPARMCATVAICAALSACGSGSGSGDTTVGDVDENGNVIPLIGGGGDDVADEDFLIDELNPDFIGNQDDLVDDGCDGLAGTDVDSSTANWDDNCRIQFGGTHQVSSYAQGIQRIVFCRGFSGGNDDILAFADGDFGPITADQVQAFQVAEGIGADGVVGPETWGALQDVLQFINSEDSRDVWGVDVPEGAACDGISQFFQTFIPDETGVTGESTGWTMAQSPGSGTAVPFSTGSPQ